MPVDFTIDKKGNLLHRTISGEVDIPKVMEALEGAVRHPDYHPGMKSLTDLREWVPVITSSEIRQISEYLLADVEARKGMDAAIVVSERVSYGLMRMVEQMSDNPDLHISVFYDMDEAKRWLGVA